MNAQPKISNLDELVFDNRFVRELPADPENANFRRQVNDACYSRVMPTPVVNPQLVAYSKEVASLLDLPDSYCQSSDFVQVFSGNRLIKGMEAYATCYGGHQFGVWAGQLGDGRAINLGDLINRKDQRWALQLKGSGPTPYSRNSDGLAVLRSSIREFLCSEAMFHLGVPTTRALSVIATGETVIRDMFYNGNPKEEPGAVVCRVAQTFTRFGHFQILTARREIELLRKFADYTIRTDFPHLGKPSKQAYLSWFEEVCKNTAEMIVHWQRVGFVHGVMNTDNMSILGLTIDYGPYGWLDNYDPDWTPNTTDAAERRYRFGNQPQIAYWNLGQLANAIYPLIEEVELLQQALSAYPETFERRWPEMVANKLGFQGYTSEDDDLISELFAVLRSVETDMTLFFRLLADFDLSANMDTIKFFSSAFYKSEQLTQVYVERFHHWLKNYKERIQKAGISETIRRDTMNKLNPRYVLRNYLAQLAIDKAEKGDYSMVNELLEILRHPYDEQPGNDRFAEKRPEWARQRPGCSMLSCSS